MKWYEFDQNNSGGSFHAPAIRLYVEAESKEVACARASAHGVYFDGIDAGIDCSCCGDRWMRPYRAEDDRPEPEYERSASTTYPLWAREAGIPLAMWVHADGTIEKEDAK